MRARRRRIDLDAFREALDLERVKALYTSALATLGEVPCLRWRGEACSGPPGAHQTCSRCFCWRDCPDAACDHPACGRGVSSRFRDAFCAEFEALAGLDVLVARADPVPLSGHGRMVELVRLVGPDEKAGAKTLAALQKANGAEWVQLYDLPIETTKHVNAEVWLVTQRLPVEVSSARYQLPCWVALDAGAGLEVGEGGTTASELRLASLVQERLFA